MKLLEENHRRWVKIPPLADTAIRCPGCGDKGFVTGHLLSSPKLHPVGVGEVARRGRDME